MHGDPRLENIILVDDKLVWIDFRECEVVAAPVHLKRSYDLRIFLKIFYAHCERTDMQDSDFDQLKTQYGAFDSTILHLPALPAFKQAVWDIVKKED